MTVDFASSAGERGTLRLLNDVTVCAQDQQNRAEALTLDLQHHREIGIALGPLMDTRHITDVNAIAILTAIADAANLCIEDSARNSICEHRQSRDRAT